MVVASAAWGDEVTFDLQTIYSSVSDWVNVTEDSQNGVKLTYSKGTGSDVPCYYKNGTALRLYKNNTFTVSSQNTITKIVMTSSNSTLKNFSTTTGNYSNGTWTGSANSIVFNVSAASRLTKVVVTIDNTEPGTSDTNTLVFDFTSNPGGWPTDNSTTLTDYTFKLNNIDYTFALKNAKCNSGYLMLTQPAVIGLPAIEGFKLTKVVASNTSGCSTSTKVGISSSSTEGLYIAGGAIQTWSTTNSSYTYNLTSTEVNTMYYLYVTNKNAQVKELTLTYEAVDASQPQLSADNVDILYSANNGAITYTLSNPVEGGILTASTSANWLAIGTVGEAIPFTCTANEAHEPRSATVTLTYTYETDKTISKVVTITQAAAPVIYSTIPALFEAAKSTETGVYVTFNNWVVSGVSLNGKNVFVTDGTNGFVIFDDNGGLDKKYSAGDILSGTAVSCNLVLFNGFAEIKNLNVDDLTIEPGGTVNTANIAMASLSGVNTGTLVSYKNLTCSVSSNKYYLSDGTTTLQVYNSLYAFEPLEAGKKYNITGVYQLYGSTKEIMPRSANDIKEVLEPSMALSTTSVEALCHETTGTINVTYNNIADNSSAAVVLCNAEGEATTYDWLSASINNDKNVDYTIQANAGEARTAYLKVTVGEVFTDLVTITQSEYVQTTAYTLATSITSGGRYIITNGTDKAMGIDKGNNRAGADVVIEEGTALVAANAGVFEFVIESVDDKYTIYDDVTPGYLYASSSTSNQLKTEEELDNNNNGIWTISFDASTGEASIVANGSNTRNVMRYNPNNGTPLFACYEAGKQNPVFLYEKIVAAPVTPAAPTVFHDSGEYEGTLSVPMFAEEGATIKYTVNDGDEQTYTGPVTVNEDAVITAWAEVDGVESDVVTREFTIVEKAKGAVVEDGYYTIQNNDDKYVNVAGRKTVTLVSDTKSAGTVIRVKADEGGVKVLRSQAVDLPRYAERAMSYVPEIVKEVVKKLAANVDDPIIGEQGADLILDKFNKEFDYHLYLEGENNTYRIYGRTPSMKPVVDFYAENKELIDGRLLKVEGFVKEVLQKVVEKVGRGQSVVDMFKVKTIWQNMGGTLTEPTDDASTLKFYEEVLSSETNVWDFAYQTGMLYWEKVKGYLTDNISELGDYGKYIEKIPQIRPNFRYYIVPGENGVDIISEGNSQITDASTAWTLTKREGFDVTFDATLSKNNGKEMYKTLYVDFGYKLPDGVTALKVTAIDENTGVAKTEEIGQEVAPQTPVLLKSDKAGDITLTIGDNFGSAVTDNQLVGADYLINKYEINTPQVESIFTLLANLSKSLANEYSYLKRKNAGTVNNKYFFGLTKDDLKLCFYLNDNEEKDCVVRSLSMGDEKLGFYNNWTAKANEAFLVSEQFNPVKLTLKGDVNRDGSITIADVTALVNIILGKATEGDTHNYDFEAAHVNADEEITIADVTALVNIILGK